MYVIFPTMYINIVALWRYWNSALFVWASWIVYGIGLTNGLSFGWDSVFGGVFVKLNEFFSLVMLVAQKYFTWETFSFTELGLFPHIFSFYMELNVVL